MWNVGIWERGDGVYDAVCGALEHSGVQAAFRRGSHPAELAAQPLDLLCAAPAASGWAGINAAECRCLLLPGSLGPLARGLRCKCAVSYGTSPKDTLTFSSLEGDQICLALQRELVTLDGSVVEQQEIILPFQPGLSPLPFLAAAGVLLLLGVHPERLSERGLL